MFILTEVNTGPTVWIHSSFNSFSMLGSNKREPQASQTDKPLQTQTEAQKIIVNIKAVSLELSTFCSFLKISKCHF